MAQAVGNAGLACSRLSSHPNTLQAHVRYWAGVLFLSTAFFVLMGIGLSSSAIPATLASLKGVTSASAFGKLPLSFELNQGQTHESVKFLARSQSHTVLLMPGETALVLRNPKYKPALTQSHWQRKSHLLSRAEQRHLGIAANVAAAAGSEPSLAVLRLKLIGAYPAPPMEGLDPLPTKSHYLIGNDPTKWIMDVPHYAKVKYHDVYPGIDQIFYSKEGALEYDLIVKPGADPKQIRLAFEGIEPVQLNSQGDAILRTAVGSIVHRKPLVYQNIAGQHIAIAARYVVQGAGELGIEISHYDRSRPLVIDPAIVYSTYLGGNDVQGGQIGQAIAVGSDGSAYVTGSVWAIDFPTVNPIQGSLHPGTSSNLFIAKLASDGQSLVYATYLGGDVEDDPYGIALDVQGNAYVAGQTFSNNFPTVNARQSIKNGSSDGFIVKLTADGRALVYSTYLGGQGDDSIAGIAVDAQGNAYVGGETSSADFPIQNAYQVTAPSTYTQFVTKLDTNGGLVYSTYLGAIGTPCCDQLTGIGVDSAGSAYVAGITYAATFPVLNQILGLNCPGLFVTKFDPTGSALAYSTCIAGPASSINNVAIAVDAQGSVCLTGGTSSTTFPTVNAYQPALRSASGYTNVFVTQLTPDGGTLAYSTYLGGSGNTYDQANAIAVDGGGNIYVTGETQASDFPLVNPLPGSFASDGLHSMAFVAKLNPAASPASNTVVFSTMLGAPDGDQSGRGIAVDTQDNAYVTGWTGATDFPVVNPLKATNPNLTSQAFITKISSSAVLMTSVNLAASASTINAGEAVTFSASVTGNSPTGVVTFYDGSTVLGVVTLSANASASWTTTTLDAGVVHSVTARYSGDANNGASVSAPVNVTVNAIPAISMSSPTNNTYFIAPATIGLAADAVVTGDTITRVDFYNGTSLLGAATTSPYLFTWNNVPVGTYTLMARVTSGTGLTARSAPVTVTVLDHPTITLIGLADGATINRDSLIVRGNVQAPPNSSITVNGVVGTIAPDGSFFVNNVPLTLGENTLTITITTPDGQTISQTLLVTSTAQAKFAFSASPTQGLAPLTVNFILTNIANARFVRADLSCQGNGTVDHSAIAPSTTLGTCTYATPGVYTAKVQVFNSQNRVIYRGMQMIQVGTVTAQDVMLRGVYYAMLARLKVRDINGALSYITAGVHDKYNAVFTAIDAVGPNNLATVVDKLGTIQDGEVGADYAEYVIVRDLPDGSQQAFLIYLIRGEDGIWRIDGM